MTKSTIAKLLGWGQVLITYLNDVLAQNGGVIPTTRAAWFHLVSSIVLGGGVHIASNTSVAHPEGVK